VVVDAAGPIAATVERVVPGEDDARLVLSVDGGTLRAVVPFPAPVVGELVRVRIVGGARFAESAAHLAADSR
jgi:hypothetical protein